MAKRILDVGNCSLDFSTIQTFLTSHFDCEVVQTHAADDTLAELKSSQYDLVLVNRLLDRDGTAGTDVIREIKSDADGAETPVMLVTNYDEHQDAAESVGAVRGFGKLSLKQPETLEKLRAFLA